VLLNARARGQYSLIRRENSLLFRKNLIGCPACNRWQGDRSAFVIELEVEDWEALGKLSNFMKWTLRCKKNP